MLFHFSFYGVLYGVSYTGKQYNIY